MCKTEMTSHDQSGPGCGWPASPGAAQASEPPDGTERPLPRLFVCRDQFDPEVGSWVMDDPQVPWRPLLKSLRQDCESIQAHSS